MPLAHAKLSREHADATAVERPRGDAPLGRACKSSDYTDWRTRASLERDTSYGLRQSSSIGQVDNAREYFTGALPA